MCVVFYLFLFRSLFCVSQLGEREKCQRMAEPYLANYLTSKIIRLRLNRSHQNRQFFISFYYLEEIYHNLQLANLFADIHSQENWVLCCVTSSSFQMAGANIYKWRLFPILSSVYQFWTRISIHIANLSFKLLLACDYNSHFIALFIVLPSSFINKCTINDGNQWPANMYIHM